MRRKRNQENDCENGFSTMNNIRVNVAKAFAGILIRICNICKFAVTAIPILIIIYVVGFLFFRERMLTMIESIKSALLI